MGESFVEIRITGTAEQCRQEMQGLLGSGIYVSKDTSAKPATPAKVEKAPKKETAPVETSAPAEPKTVATATPATKIEDISAKVAELLSKHPRAKVVEFLASFGVKKGSDLPSDKWTEFLTKADAL